VPKQRFLYYLTPKGFAEKARLTAEFLSSSYQFYRQAREDVGQVMADAASQGHKRLAVIGAGELAEIVALVSEETSVEIVAFIAPGSARKQIAGRPVLAGWSEVTRADGALLATFENAGAVLKAFRTEQPSVPVFVPRQLRALLGPSK
jgi:hypothetical protein